MTEKPPEDTADHAEDFSRRYADDLEIATGEVMIELGLSDDEMGLRDPARNLEHHTFFPGERTCGGVSPGGQINLDSGVMDPAVMDGPYGEECGRTWRRTRLRDRMRAVVAHEVAEKACGGDHEAALAAASETTLPITNAARELLRAMEAGFRGR